MSFGSDILSSVFEQHTERLIQIKTKTGLHDPIWFQNLFSFSFEKPIFRIWSNPTANNLLNFCWTLLNKLVKSAVLNSSPRVPPLCIFCMSLFVNTPDSDHQLVHELCSDWHDPYTVFIALYSLSRGNPLKFTSLRNIHSHICATPPPAASSHTDETYKRSVT